MTIDEYLRRTRTSQERLAELVGASRPTVARWLRGEPVREQWVGRLVELGIDQFPRYTCVIIPVGHEIRVMPS